MPDEQIKLETKNLFAQSFFCSSHCQTEAQTWFNEWRSQIDPPDHQAGGGIVGKTAGLKHIFHKKNCLADNLKHFRRLPILGDSLRLC